jgi:hypothetical protein
MTHFAYLLNKAGHFLWNGSPLPDEVGQWRNPLRVGDPIGEVVPKGNPELSTGLLSAHKGISTASPQVAAGATADLALLHRIAQGLLAAIGM